MRKLDGALKPKMLAQVYIRVLIKSDNSWNFSIKSEPALMRTFIPLGSQQQQPRPSYAQRHQQMQKFNTPSLCIYCVCTKKGKKTCTKYLSSSTQLNHSITISTICVLCSVFI